MDTLFASNVEELKKLFVTRMGDYEAKLQQVLTGTSPLHPDVSSLSQEFTEFKAFVWQALSRIKTQMELLGLGLDRHETIMRKKVLLFHGLPEKDNEKLISVVHKVISDQLKLLDVSMDDIQVCHRLGSSQARNRPTLVRFRNIDHRQAVWECKTSMKGTGITITEFLTPTRHKIFTAARSHFGTKNAWTVEGRIVILLPDKSRKKVETMSELQALIAKHPLSVSDAAANAKQSSEPHSPSGAGTAGPRQVPSIPKKNRRR